MCKRVRHTYFCEELFLVKHKTKHSCESALFYDLPRETLLQNYHVNYYYNTTVQPSVLDGGTHIVLANMLTEKRLICSYAQGLARPLPASPYALRYSMPLSCPNWSDMSSKALQRAMFLKPPQFTTQPTWPSGTISTPCGTTVSLGT